MVCNAELNFMANMEEDPSSNQPSGLRVLLKSPGVGRKTCSTPGDSSQRSSPVVVRRTPSQPISIIRSTSVPGQLQDVDGVGGGGGGSTKARSRLFNDDVGVRDSLQHKGGHIPFEAHSLPPPMAPLLAGSLPPSRFLDDLPPLVLGPQANFEAPLEFGSLSSSWKERRNVVYATSCPATLGGEGFGGRSNQRLRVGSMLALEECLETDLETMDTEDGESRGERQRHRGEHRGVG
ncbi:unnamed protein product, partial [Choristocarpus tenellus]